MAVQAGVIETRLSADVAQFTAGMRSAQNAFQGTVSTINSGSKSITSSFGQVQNATDSVELAVNKLQRTFKRGMAAIGAGFILPSIFSKAHDAIIGFNQQLDSATIAMNTFVGSEEGAQRMLATLQDFAARTPFNFQDLLGTSQQMLAMGVAAKDLIPRLTAIGDAAAALGGSPEVLQRVQRALGQIQAKGRVQAEELMQLAEVGIPAYEYIAQVTGGDIPAALDAMRKGQIDAATAITALLDGMTRDFSGMMDAQSQTMMGALSTVQDYVQMTVARLGRPIFDAVRDTMLKIAAFLSSPKTVKAAEKFADNFAKALKNVGQIIGQVMSQVGPIITKTLSAAYDLGRALVSGLDGAKPVLLALVGAAVGLAKAFEGILQMLAPLLKLFAEQKTLATALVVLIGALALKNKLFGETTEGAAKAGTAFVASLRESVANIKDTIAYQQRLASFSGKTVSSFQAFGASVSSAFMAARAAALAFMSSVLPLLAVTVAVTGITKAFTAWSERNKDLNQRTKDFTAALKENTDALLENKDAIAKGESGAQTMANSFAQTGEAVDKLTMAFGELGQAYDFEKFVLFADSFDQQAKAALMARGATSDMAEAVVDMVNELDKGNNLIERFALKVDVAFGAGAPPGLAAMAMALEEIQDQIENTDFGKIAAAQAQQMVGSGQVTAAMVAEAQALTDVLVKQNQLGPAAAALTFNQQLLALATGQVRAVLELNNQQTERYAALVARLNSGIMQTLGPSASFAEVLAWLAAQTKDGEVAFEDFTKAIYGNRASMISWKREIASSRSNFASLISTFEYAGLTVNDLELAVFDLGDQLLNVAYKAEMLGQSQQEAAAEMAAMVANFSAAARQAGFTKGQIDALIRSLGILDNMDPRINIAVGLDISEIKARVEAIRRQLAVAIQRSPEAAALLRQQLAFWESMAAAFASVPSGGGGGGGGRGGGGGGGGAATDPYAWFQSWLDGLQQWAVGLINKDFAVYLASAAGPEIMKTFTSIIDDAMNMAMDKIAPAVLAKLQGLRSSFEQLADLADVRDQLMVMIDGAVAALNDLETAYYDVRVEAGLFDSSIEGIIAPGEMSSLDKARQAYAVYEDMLTQRNQLVQQAVQFRSSVASGISAPLTGGNLIGGSERILRTAQEYLKNITALRDRGFPPDMIAEVVRAGMNDGGKIAKRLLSLSGGEMQKLASIREQIASIGMETGQIAAEVIFGADIASADAALDAQYALVRSLYQQAVADAKKSFDDQKLLVGSLESALADTNTQIAKLVAAIQQDLTSALVAFLAQFSRASGFNTPVDWTTILSAISASPAPGAGETIVVNISGSVMTERDMIEAIRLGLLRSQAAGKPLVLT